MLIPTFFVGGFIVVAIGARHVKVAFAIVLMGCLFCAVLFQILYGDRFEMTVVVGTFGASIANGVAGGLVGLAIVRLGLLLVRRLRRTQRVNSNC